MAKLIGRHPLTQLYRRQVGDNVLNFRQNLYRERLHIVKSLYKKDLLSHYGCVNAIEFSNDGNFLVSGGDDRRILLWKIEESIAGVGEPKAMNNQHYSNIFCLRFNNDHTKVLSGGNDDAVLVHNVETADTFDVFLHTKPVYGISVDTTNDQIFATAGEDGTILIFDLRTGTDVMSLPKSRAPFHSVEFHPMDGNYLVTGNGKDGAALWDIRDYDAPCIRYGGEKPQSCMSVRFNAMGTHVLALRRRLPPILYKTTMETAVCQFYHPDYYNSCTMKSCSFAGENDEYILSGSDDFNLYMWRTTDADPDKNGQWVDTSHMVLSGHRSVVNQVRYNPQRCLIASSGVEKVIKLWQPFESEGWVGGLTEEANGPENPRVVFTHEEYVSLMNSTGQSMTHDYSHENTSEDPRMMAFFDSLVQREIEGWNSDDSDKSSYHSSDGSSRPTSTQQSDSDSNTSYNVMANGCLRNRTDLKNRTKYVNRIAWLIASKRSTLKRMALKGSAQTSRRVKSSKVNGRKLQRTSVRVNWKNSGKRARVNNVPTRVRTRSDNDTLKKGVKRRLQQHINAPPPHRNRRVSKSTSLNFTPNIDSGSGNSSSDDESPPRSTIEPNTKPRNFPNDSSSPGANQNDALPSTSSSIPVNLAVPSTSTGITASGTLFHAAVTVQSPDSDDDPTPQNSPPITRHTLIRTTRQNGCHKPNIVTYSSGGVDDEPFNENRPYTRHSRRKRNHSLNTNFQLHYSHLSSHSSSRISSSSGEDAESTESSAPLFQTVAHNREGGSSSSTALIPNGFGKPYTVNENTPIRSRPHGIDNYTPDSGISSASGRQDGNNNSSVKKSVNGSEPTKLFLQKVSRIRRNYRNIGDVSNSDEESE